MLYHRAPHLDWWGAITPKIHTPPEFDCDERTKTKKTVQFGASDQYDWHIKNWEVAYITEECNFFGYGA